MYLHGQVIVIGGDFRQTLPDVAHGKEIDIIETCISPVSCSNISCNSSLITNMPSENLNQLLLNIGIGAVQPIEGATVGTIQILDHNRVSDITRPV